MLQQLFVEMKQPADLGTQWAKMLGESWISTVGDLAILLQASRNGDTEGGTISWSVWAT